MRVGMMVAAGAMDVNVAVRVTMRMVVILMVMRMDVIAGRVGVPLGHGSCS